jgi:hypothetical protein
MDSRFRGGDGPADFFLDLRPKILLGFLKNTVEHSVKYNADPIYPGAKLR